MKSHLATLGSDQINKYGYRLDIRALESSVKQGWQGTPMFISHDFHRPAGISKAIGLHLHSTQALLKGIIILPETPDERNAVEDFAGEYLARKLAEIEDNDRVQLTTGLTNHLSSEAIFVRRECVSVLDPGIAKRVFPELFPTDETDKRSLVQIKNLQVIAPGVFKIGDYAVFAHRYFRRSLSQLNNLNGIFLEKLCKLRNETNLDVKIALDADSIGLVSTYLTPIELEYWRGPKFDDDLSSIPVGVTCHKASDRERYYHGIDRTEFWWHMQSGKRSLECEEILDNASFGIGSDVYGCRYVHSMVDEASNLPDHLDGAIREYGEEPFMGRIDVDISRAGKNTRYVKLWRIDGEIGLSTWKEMICDFFRGNSLVGEYLHGDNTQDQDEQAAPTSTLDPPNNMGPVPISEEDAVHIAVSYHSPDVFPLGQNRSIKINRSLATEDSCIKYIEFSALDLIKLFEREVSERIILPEGIPFIAFEDMDINYPPFFFQGETALEDAKAFIRCLSALCHKFSDIGAQRFITASIGVRYEDNVALFSFAGFANLLADVFDHGIDKLPEAFVDIGSWCEETQDILSKLGHIKSFTKAGQDLFTQSGDFFLRRPFLDAELFSIDKDFQISLRLPPTEEVIAQALCSGKLHATPAFVLVKCTCSGCNSSYLDCPCCVFLNESSGVTPTDFKLLGIFLTERPARSI